MLSTDKDLRDLYPRPPQPFLQLSVVVLVHVYVPLLGTHSQVVKHRQDVLALLVSGPHSPEGGRVDDNLPAFLRLLCVSRMEEMFRVLTSLHGLQ